MDFFIFNPYGAIRWIPVKVFSLNITFQLEMPLPMQAKGKQ